MILEAALFLKTFQSFQNIHRGKHLSLTIRVFFLFDVALENSKFLKPFFCKFEISFSNEAFKNCRESIKVKSPMENEIYFSSLVGIHEIGLFFINPIALNIKCAS